VSFPTHPHIFNRKSKIIVKTIEQIKEERKQLEKEGILKSPNDEMSSGRKIPQDRDIEQKNVQRGRWDFRPLGRVAIIEGDFIIIMIIIRM